MYAPTDRTSVRRLPERASYDTGTVHAILDEGFICHVGFVLDGQPCVIPTGYTRVGETLYLHGSTGSRLGLHPDADVCVTVTLLDGLILARSAFHHSMNYRSVVVFGRTRAVTDPAEKDAVLQALVEHIVPGRSQAVRGATAKERAATVVLAVPLVEVSAKIRTGPPKDDEEDYELPIWAGILPLGLHAGPPEPDPLLAPGVPVPAHVIDWHRPTPHRRSEWPNDYDGWMTDHPTNGPRATRCVLVVCAGNICRSPTAEAVIRLLGAGHPVVDLEVQSRGTQDWNVGKHAHPAMTRIAAARGYDLSAHIAAQVTAEDLEWADDVLVMDDENYQQLVGRFPADRLRHVRLLDPAGIPDPWLVDQDRAYTSSLDRIELAVRTYLASLEASAEHR